MPFIVAIADFPQLTSKELSAIFNKLEQENWKKMHHHSGVLYTVWNNTTFCAAKDEAVRMASLSFYTCCTPYCIPRLVVEWDAKDIPLYITM